jgi:hypothetical protein
MRQELIRDGRPLVAWMERSEIRGEVVTPGFAALHPGYDESSLNVQRLRAGHPAIGIGGDLVDPCLGLPQ